MPASGPLPSSFRDPSGFMFVSDGLLYRQVNRAYAQNYDHLMSSGLYQELVGSNLLISHEEVADVYPARGQAHRVLKHELIPFVSYPYEWSFSQLKHAALATLRIQKRALDFGMSLKDCSAYNIQFSKGKPVLIDTLSFERYREGEPWIAYRQFCRHFLAPLALMSCRDVRLNQLLRVHIDGVPLDLASSLLPFWTRLRFSLLSHIHLHARSERHFASRQVDLTRRKVSRTPLLALIDNLESAINGLKWRPRGTEWAGYYGATSYSGEALDHKRQLVGEFLDDVNPSPKIVWDLGANTGLFSRIASDRGIHTVSLDVDPACVEVNYLWSVEKRETMILPLLNDLTNPSASIGWANEERMSLVDRGPADAVLALALIHHLAISNNVPLGMIAEFFSRICQSLIIEFVPKNDWQVRRLLATRTDIFDRYDQRSFELEFGEYFTVLRTEAIKDTDRILYLMERRPDRA